MPKKHSTRMGRKPLPESQRKRRLTLYVDQPTEEALKDVETRRDAGNLLRKTYVVSDL